MSLTGPEESIGRFAAGAVVDECLTWIEPPRKVRSGPVRMMRGAALDGTLIVTFTAEADDRAGFIFLLASRPVLARHWRETLTLTPPELLITTGLTERRLELSGPTDLTVVHVERSALPDVSYFRGVLRVPASASRSLRLLMRGLSPGWVDNDGDWLDDVTAVSAPWRRPVHAPAETAPVSVGVEASPAQSRPVQPSPVQPSPVPPRPPQPSPAQPSPAQPSPAPARSSAPSSSSSTSDDDVWAELVVSLVRNAMGRAEQLGPPPSPHHADAVAFVRQNLADPRLDATMIAKSLHLSVRSVQEMFRHDGGVSRYVRRTRGTQVVRHLTRSSTTTTDLDQIARQYGFGGRRSLERAVREVCGLTPAECMARRGSPAHPVVPGDSPDYFG